MRIIVVAIACHPERGSENYVGWTAVQALRRNHDLVVITHGENREALEGADFSGGRRPEFHFLRPKRNWHPNRMVARIQDWADYRAWTREARTLAERLSMESRFDLAHHVTYATWRIPSPLSELDLPFVWGPVGGGETLPMGFLGTLSPAAAAFEMARIAANTLGVLSPKAKAAARGASVILANNGETRKALLRLGAPPERIDFLSQSFFPPARMAKFLSPSEKADPAESGLSIFAGGNLEGRKGVALVLNALVKIKSRGIKFRFTYGGQGPEFTHLQNLTRKLGLTREEVRLGEILSAEEYMHALQSSHVYLLPSLREGAPITLIEAMLSRCVPIVADCGGAAMIVTPECGIRIPVTDAPSMIDRIADELAHLATHPSRLVELGAAASSRVQDQCSESAYLDGIEAAYQKALLQHSPPSRRAPDLSRSGNGR